MTFETPVTKRADEYVIQTLTSALELVYIGSIAAHSERLRYSSKPNPNPRKVPVAAKEKQNTYTY